MLFFWNKGFTQSKQNGFTLIELVIVLTLTGILVAAISPFVYTNVDAFIRIRAGKNVLQGARIGLTRMTEELKRATNIDYGYSNRIRFDFEKPDGSNESNIEYEYYDDEAVLTREDEPLVPLVQDFTIQYWDINDNLINPGWGTAAIQRIEISISVGSPEIYTVLEAQVAPRMILIATAGS
jgi:prepilin-type N-terminal cleavage/methylation domain-containing protein